jgi:hypothetical protein
LQKQGAINGTPIGNIVPSTGAFTTVSASGEVSVTGNVKYINVNELTVQDPLIGLGRGPNNTPLTTNDGKDRGTEL